MRLGDMLLGVAPVQQRRVFHSGGLAVGSRSDTPPGVRLVREEGGLVSVVGVELVAEPDLVWLSAAAARSSR